MKITATRTAVDGATATKTYKTKKGLWNFINEWCGTPQNWDGVSVQPKELAESGRQVADDGVVVITWSTKHTASELAKKASAAQKKADEQVIDTPHVVERAKITLPPAEKPGYRAVVAHGVAKVRKVYTSAVGLVVAYKKQWHLVEADINGKPAVGKQLPGNTTCRALAV